MSQRELIAVVVLAMSPIVVVALTYIVSLLPWLQA